MRVHMKELERRLAAGNRFAAARRNVVLNVFEVLFALLILPTSLSWLMYPATFAPSLLTQEFHESIVRAMGGMLLFGALLVLMGIFAVLPRIERAGLALWGPTVALYTFMLVSTPSPMSSVSQRALSIGVYGAFATACLVRYVYLGEVIKMIRRGREDG